MSDAGGRDQCPECGEEFNVPGAKDKERVEAAKAARAAQANAGLTAWSWRIWPRGDREVKRLGLLCIVGGALVLPVALGLASAVMWVESVPSERDEMSRQFLQRQFDDISRARREEVAEAVRREQEAARERRIEDLRRAIRR